MADAVVFFAAESPLISASKIQRQCYIGYNVADVMLKSLYAAKAVIHLHEPCQER